MTDYVITGLVKRRAELAGEIKTTDTALTRLLTDLEHIDGAIRAYDPAYRPKKLVLSRGVRNDLARTGLEVLRVAEAPMALREVTLAILARHGKTQPDAKAMTSLSNRVRIALRRQKANGVVRQIPGPGQLMLWEVARAP